MGALADLFLPFPWPLTVRQDVYLFGMQGLTAMCVDFGANFGIAYAMYHHQPHVKMWVFSENTIAGDLGVTPLIQCAVSMVITSTLVHTDLHHRAVRPLAFVYPHVEHLPDPAGFFDSLRRRGRAKPPALVTTADSSSASSSSASTAVAVPPTTAASGEPKPSPHIVGGPSPPSSSTETLPARSFRYYLLMFLRFTFEGTEHNMLLSRSLSFKARLGRLAWTILQGLAIGVVFGLPFWCLAVVILGPIYGTGDMGDVWAPQAIKGVYGGLLGLVTNPVIAALALGSQAEHHLIPLTVDEQTAAAAAEEKTTTGAVHASSVEVEGGANPALAPPAKAVRRGSVASSSGTSRRRPSITANPSTMAVLPLGANPTPRSFAALAVAPPASEVDPPQQQAGATPPRPPNRPRAGTTASEYSLGGTGGRAQRPRADSRASVRSMVGVAGRPAATAVGGGATGPVLLGAPFVSTAATAAAEPTAAAAFSTTTPVASRARAASSASASSLSSSSTTNDTAGASAPAAGAGAVHRLRQAAALEAPRESLELREDERSAAAAAAGEVSK